MNQFLILDGLYTIDKKEILGRGSYGAVYKCYKANSSEIFAVKVSTIMNDQHRKCALNEATTLSNFNHPNIVGFIDFKYTTNELFLITELCESI